ncbi:uncharacterized protein LOC134464030 isoform X2 [Engraulis encrasicolus]|uniref:uncharacterized protein LOC134464030 isoform X2 n=1 Tax=Engraulis encrasicolus TaxID=184585 RepID=UPI002FD29328
MEYEINELSYHVDASHRQTCSDLEKASHFITDALQSEVRRNTGLCMLIHRLEERAAENGRSLSEQVESNRQLKLQVDELQKQLEDKDNSLTQAKQSIAALKHDVRDLQQQLHNRQNSQRTIQEVAEWLQQDGESQPNDVKAEGNSQQDAGIKEEGADDGYPCDQSDDTEISVEQTASSSADIKSERLQEAEDGSDMAPNVNSVMCQSSPDAVRASTSSAHEANSCAEQAPLETDWTNDDGENPNTTSVHESATVNTSMSRSDAQQQQMSTQKQLTMRVVSCDGDTRKMTMVPLPNTVDELVNWLKKAMDLDYNFVLQYEDPDFDLALNHLSYISELPEKPTIRIIPLLDLVPVPLSKGRSDLNEGVTVNGSTSRGDAQQQEMSTQKQLTMRVISCDGDARKMTMAPFPNTVDDLVNWLKKAMRLDYNLRLQYEDPDFDSALVNVSNISQLPEMPTIRIIPLVDLVPKPLRKGRCELNKGITVNASTSRGDAQQQEISTQNQLTMRVVSCNGDTRRMTMTPVPNTVDDLVNWLKQAMDLDYNFVLQYEDPDFDGALTHLSHISELPAKPTVRIIPLLDLVPVPLSELHHELLGGSSPDTVSEDNHVLPAFSSSSLQGGQKKPWPEVFCIPQFSANVEYRLRQGNQMYLRDGKFLFPTKELKHCILETLAEEIYSYKAYPNQWDIDIVAKALVEKHPCLREPSGGSGRQGWIYSLKFKMGNYRTKLRQLGRADVVVNSGKRGRRNNADGEFPARNIKKPRKGELNYLPQFPDGMDAAGLEVLRDAMVKEVRKKSQDGTFMKRNMHVTFALRREEIVKSIPDVGQIMQRWPALFTESQVCLEFNRIVDRNLKEEFFGALDGLSTNFLKILRKKPGRTGQQLADLLDQTTIMDPVAIRCLVLRGLPIILGDDASMFFKSSSTFPTSLWGFSAMRMTASEAAHPHPRPYLHPPPPHPRRCRS